MVSKFWSAPLAAHPVSGALSIPGSKSETARALVLSALAEGPTRIVGGLDCRDSQLMIGALTQFGVQFDLDGSWLVKPAAQLIPPQKAIDCGLAGTVMRFVAALAATVPGEYHFSGDDEASSRPMSGLLAALRRLGCTVDGDALPFTLTVPPQLASYSVEVDSSATSQFLSALLLVGARLPNGLTVRHVGADLPSVPHIQMTIDWLARFGVTVNHLAPHTWQVPHTTLSTDQVVVEPDLSTAAVFLASAALTDGEVTIRDWPTDSTQPGAKFLSVLTRMGAQVSPGSDGLTVKGTGTWRSIDIDLNDAAELTPVVAACCLFADGQSTISGVAHIRGHETDRLAALAHEFSELGAGVTETEDGLIIDGVRRQPQLRSRLFGTYADHRMAHAGALVGLLTPGTKLDDVSCTSKTMPTFAEDWLELIGNES